MATLKNVSSEVFGTVVNAARFANVTLEGGSEVMTCLPLIGQIGQANLRVSLKSAQAIEAQADKKIEADLFEASIDLQERLVALRQREAKIKVKAATP